MSMPRLLSVLDGRAREAAEGMTPPREGTVTSYDPDAYSVKVMLQPEEIETGWCPIMVGLAGNGTGVYYGPEIGDLALVVFLEGDGLVGRCLGFLPNDVDKPPRVESGEIHLVHKSGDFVKITAEGIFSKGLWKHDGDFLATGDITDNDPGNTVTVKELRDAYDAHRHPETGSITGTTDKPT